MPGRAVLAIPALLLAAAASASVDVPPDATPSHARPTASADVVTLERLAAHRTWRRLLHVEHGGDGERVEPVIVTPDFYLTPSRPELSPRAELIATLEAFERAASAAAPSAAAPDDDPRCRYPARWQWLARHLPERIGTLPRARCPALRSWLDVDAVEALSLVHVSGHFANPASAFGHLLLRVELGGASGLRGLRDLGINFGAVVPPEDGPVVYILKGLFGGYEAGFTDQSFLAHDAVYSATEQRDMWAYHLDLDAEARSLLLHHLWELRRARFTYYFLRHNCAWYLSALLELVLEEPVRDARPWQLPSAVFERIDELENGRGEPLVERVSFVPSLEREFLHGFAALESGEARRANALIADADALADDVPAGDTLAGPSGDALAGLSSEALDVLLAWADLGSAGAAERRRTAWLARKRTLLGERLRRPPGPASAPPPPVAPPARGPRSLTVAVGAARDVETFDADADGAPDEDPTGVTTLRLAPYAHDLLDANRASLRDADFRLLDLSLGIDRNGDARLRSLDLIAVEKLATPSVAIADRSRRTWRTALRLNGERGDCVNCSPVVAKAGIGLADNTFLASRALTLYAYADAELGSTRSLAGPSLGLLYRPAARLALRLEGRLLAASEGEAAAVLGLGAFAALGGQWGAALSASDVNGRTRAAFELGRRF